MSKSTYQLLVGGLLMLILGGVGCLFDTKNIKIPDQAVLYADKPPLDCGDRNPNKLNAHITISNPLPFVDEPITFDASCSVGRITKIEWDFDTFNGWPKFGSDVSSTLNYRWQNPINIDHPDLQAGYQGSQWDKNTLSPFYQNYTPQREGITRARLRVYDAQGRVDTAALVYTIQPKALSAQNAYAPLHAYFRLDGAPSYEDGRIVYLPWNGKNGHAYSDLATAAAHADRSTGNMAQFTWNARLYSGEAEKKNEFMMADTPWRTDIDRTDMHGLVSLTIPEFLPFERTLPVATPLLSETSPYERGWPANMEITLRLKDIAQSESEYTQHYQFIDSNTNDILYPQFDLHAQARYGRSATGTSYYSEEIHGLNQSIPELQNSYPVGETTAPTYPPQATPILDPGQLFRLKDYSVWRRPSVRGPMTIAFDVGDGVFHAANIPALVGDALQPRDVSYEAQAPLAAGTYLAHMRMTDAGNPAVTITVERPYHVRQLMKGMITASPTEAKIGDLVTFDATKSLGDIFSYEWKIKKDRTIVHSEKQYHGNAGAGLLQRQMSESGNYTVELWLTENGTFRRGFIQTTYLVLASEIAGSADKNALPPGSKAGLVTPPVTFSLARAGVPTISQQDTLAVLPGDALVMTVQNIEAVQELRWDFTGDGIIDITCAPTSPYECLDFKTTAPIRCEELRCRTIHLYVTQKDGKTYEVTKSFTMTAQGVEVKHNQTNCRPTDGSMPADGYSYDC